MTGRSGVEDDDGEFHRFDMSTIIHVSVLNMLSSLRLREVDGLTS